MHANASKFANIFKLYSVFSKFLLLFSLHLCLLEFLVHIKIRTIFVHSIDQFQCIKITPNTTDLRTRLCMGNKPHKLCCYSLEPRTDVYYFRLNFLLLMKLFYWLHNDIKQMSKHHHFFFKTSSYLIKIFQVIFSLFWLSKNKRFRKKLSTCTL